MSDAFIGHSYLPFYLYMSCTNPYFLVGIKSPMEWCLPQFSFFPEQIFKHTLWFLIPHQPILVTPLLTCYQGYPAVVAGPLKV